MEAPSRSFPGDREALQVVLSHLAERFEQLPAEYRTPLQAEFNQLRPILEAVELAAPASLYETIFSSHPTGMAILTIPDLTFRLTNAAYRSILPDPSVDPIGMTIDQVLPLKEAAEGRTLLAELARGDCPRANWKYEDPQGRARHFTICVQPMVWQEQPAALLVTWEISPLVNALREVEQREAALRRSDARYRQLLETAYEGIWTIDAHGITDYINEHGAQILGYSVEEMIGRPALNFHMPEDVPHATSNLAEKRQGKSGTSEYRMRHKSGAVVWISSSTSPILDENGQYSGALAMFTDITQRLQAEQVIQSLEVQRRLLEHRERERQEIARDIHDGPVQTLVGLLFSLKAARETTQAPAFQNLLEQVAGEIRGSVQELRQVVNELRPPALLRYGLARAIQIHSEDLRSRYPELCLDLDLVEDEHLFPEETCLALYRVYQEGINNIIRHAQAQTVWVRYYPAHGRQMVLEIRDDGRGFEMPEDWVELARSNHFGVAGMKERAEALGGSLAISSQPGQGTRLEVRVPLPA